MNVGFAQIICCCYKRNTAYYAFADDIFEITENIIYKLYR